jgi:hypothetical protein
MYERINLEVGKPEQMVIGFSEAAMHLRIAGRQLKACLLESDMVQIYDLDNRAISFPITAGEAGVYRDGDTFYGYRR